MLGKPWSFSRYLTFQSLFLSWKIMYYSTKFLVLIVNSVLFFDLYLVMTNPFSIRENRVKFYYLFILVSWLVALAYVTIIILGSKATDELSEFAQNYDKHGNENDVETDLKDSTPKIIWNTCIELNYLFTVIIALRVAFLLRKQGTSL